MNIDLPDFKSLGVDFLEIFSFFSFFSAYPLPPPSPQVPLPIEYEQATIEVNSDKI